MNPMKKLFALLLVIAMVASLLPAAFAAETPAPQEAIVLTDEDYATNDLVWQQIDAKKVQLKEAGAANDEIIEAVIEIVVNAPNYKEGSLERHEDCFTWMTQEGIACLHPYVEEEVDRGPSVLGDPADPNEPSYEFIDYSTKGAPDGADVYLINPFYGVEDKFTDHYINVGQKVAAATGGTFTRYSGEDATIDKIANAMSNGAIVLVDSHGTTNTINGVSRSYLRLVSSTGLTTSDYNNGYAYKSGDRYMVSGECISAHMTKDNPGGFVWFGMCEGMKYSSMSLPMIARGAEAVFGFSQIVSFDYDRKCVSAVCDSLIAGNNLATAIATMKSTCGKWDYYYQRPSYSDALAYLDAFPIVVSAEDSYPANPDAEQNVKSTWRLSCNHENIIYVAANEPTCSKAGSNAYYTCDFCNAAFSDANGSNKISLDSISVPALGHDYVNGTCSRCGIVANVTMWHFWKGSSDANTSWVYKNYTGTSSLDTSDNGVLQTTSNGGDHYFYMTQGGSGSLNHTTQAGDIIEIRYKTSNLPTAKVGTTGTFELWYTLNNSSIDFTDSSSKTLSASVKRLENTWQTVQFTPATGVKLSRLMFDVLEENLGYSGAKVEIDYIFVGPSGNAPSKNDNSYMYFDFTNEPIDAMRYAGANYNDRNYDTGFWAYNSVNASNVAYNGNELVITPVSTATGTYVQTSTGAMGLSDNALNYVPSAGDIVQIRMKMENMQAVSGKTGVMRLYHSKNNGTSGVDASNYTIVTDFNSSHFNGEYFTVTKELCESFTAASVINAIRPQFVNISSVSGATGKIYIDYIYVGSPDKAPVYEVPCEDGHEDLETWCNGNGTHFAFCYTCGETFTDSCIIEECERAEATETTDGYVLYACVGGENGKDSYSVTGGCGYSYKDILPAFGTEPVPTEPEPTEPEPTEPEPTEPEPTEPEPTEPIDPSQKNGIILENGLYYYYVNGEIQYAAGLVCVDGDYYYIRSGGYAAIGSYWCTNTNGITAEGFYIFAEDGKMILNDDSKTGIYFEDGKYYYYIDGEIQFGAGLVMIDGSYYYIRSGGYAAIGSYWVTNTNGITQEGFYIFAEDGKMILNDTSKTGIYLEDGLYYYYVEGEIQFGAGLVLVDGDYYYIRSGGYAAIGQYWVANTNGLMQAGYYTFGNDGKMIR